MSRPILLLLMLLFSGCGVFRQSKFALEAEALWERPLPKPEPISAIITTSDYIGRGYFMCVYVDQARVWEPGDEVSDTIDNFRRTLRVEIEGLVQPDVYISELTILIYEVDENGNPLGSHGGSIQVCFSVSDLADGLHVGSISFQSTAGEQTSYHWAFKVNRTIVVDIVELPTALQIANP